MSTLEYHLYRTKFIKPFQIDLFFQNLSAKQILEAGLAEKPSTSFKQSNVWHIGNVEYFGDGIGRFAIGRTIQTTIEKFNEITGDFTELIDDSGPYTFVYFDSNLGLLGIGKKPKVASSVKSIAAKIQKLLSLTTLVQESKIDVRVEFIRDPEGFIQKIYESYAVKKFKATFTGPNPVDADELFQKPMSYYCQKIDASQGSVTVTGSFLNKEAIISIAKSTAATANDATAVIQNSTNGNSIAISFKGDGKKIILDNDYKKEDVIKAMKKTYAEVRQ